MVPQFMIEMSHSHVECENLLMKLVKRIYIPLSLPLKEWISVGTKLVVGELFTFQDQQDSCLPSEARLDSPEDQEKGKVLPRQVLFLQEYNFPQG